MKRTLLVLALGATASCGLKVGGKTLMPSSSSGSGGQGASNESGEPSEPEHRETDAERRSRESMARTSPADEDSGRDSSAGSDAVLDPGDVVVVKADPGRATAKAMAPTWCKVADKKDAWTGGRLKRSLTNAVERVWSPEVLGEIGGGLCTNPSDANWQKQTGYFMQVWMNWTGLSQKEVTASIAQRVQVDKWKSMQVETCKGLELGAEASEQEKLEAEAKRELFGCRNGVEAWRQRPGNDKRLAWYFDRTEKPASELLRMHRLFACLADPWASEDATKEPRSVARYAVCGVDARRLDGKALEKELSAGKYNDYAKTIARESFSRASIEAAEYEKVAKRMASKDEAYEQLFFRAPESAWKAWVADAAKQKRGHQAALAFDAKAYGPSRKAARGCGPDLRSGFRSYIGSGSIKTEEDAKKRAAEPLGAAMLGRLMICEAMEGNFNTAAMLMNIYKSGRQAQGPRYAVYYAVIEALGEIASDRAKFPIDVKMFDFLDWGPHLDKAVEEAAFAKKQSGANGGSLSYSTFMSDTKGTISSVKKQGDVVVVSFKTETWKEEQFDCKDTKQIWLIEPSGVIRYHQDCWSTGFKTMTHTEQPITIPADTADGLKAGMFLTGRADYPFPNAKQRLGFPTAVYEGAAKKKLISWYGIKL